MMNPAELISMCAARGIDLSHVGGNASNTDGLAGPRRMSPAERKKRLEELRSPHVDLTAKGNGTRVYRRPAWSLAEVGQALTGTPRIPTLAAMYSWAGDRSPDTYSELFWALAAFGDSTAKREHWAPSVKRLTQPRRFYVHELVGLLLEEEGDLRSYFTYHPLVHAIYMDVDELVWANQLLQPYRSLQQRYESWLGTAKSVMCRKIVGE